MKSRTIQLAAHQAGETTTRARCWRWERKDGFVLAATDHDVPLEISGEIYSARDGLTPTSIAQEASAAVANSEANGFLTPDGFTEVDTFAGLWDGAFVTVFEVNYADLSQGQMILASGNLGNIKVGRNSWNGEVRGLTQSLQKQIGEVVTKSCRYIFGDLDTCRVDLYPLLRSGEFTSVTDLRTMADTARTEEDDYWGAGVMRFTDGANAGVELEIYSFEAGQFVLHLPAPFAIEVGDSYTVSPGCRKRYTEDCREKWDNTNNFGGFPLLPGPDKVLGLGGTEGSNL